MIARALVTIIALEHLWFMIMEVFLWTAPFVRRTFGNTPEFATATAPIMKNQGVYNGFLAAGLAWAAASGNRDLALFFLGCVVIAGVVGGVTAKRSILVVQGLPAAIAFAVWMLR